MISEFPANQSFRNNNDVAATRDIATFESDDTGQPDSGLPSCTPSRLKQEKFLEALLSASTTVGNPKALAKAMLGTYGSLPRLLSASPADICQIPGISSATANCVVESYNTLLNCVFEQTKERLSLDYGALIAMAVWSIGQSSVEKVLVFYLDQRERLTGMETLCSGSESCVSVSVRTIIAAACRRNASSLLIVHNHPAGCVVPSMEDLRLIEDLFKASALIKLNLVDSLIVSNNTYYSFRDEGRL